MADAFKDLHKQLVGLGWRSETNHKGNLRLIPPFNGPSITVVPHHSRGIRVELLIKDIRRLYRHAGKEPPL